ncbi:BLUF domain-containing protein [Hydrogenophaga crassostreae]|uniref:BLUF domain-containing protein n=1 Tax=Hydrogenophaga crassostreae TaxID=1763535 RepID=UPI0012FD8EA2|nr:BLUF domain-containing protein [Hydrogenophaga crassostreae]
MTFWPDGEAEVPTGPVVRVIYVSRSEVRGAVLNEMRRIRDHAVLNNRPYGIRVALLNMNGWFLQWIEGPQDGVDLLLARVGRDRRHHGLMVIHRSQGRPRLFRPWIGAIVQTPESDRQFDLRVHAQFERFNQGEMVEPTAVWLRLSAPPAPDMPRPLGRNPRVMLLSAQGAQAFNLLEWLALNDQRTLVRRRFAGSADDAPDVESDYADFPGYGPRGVRLVANARKGLAMGMTHAFLPEFAAVVLMLDGSAGRNLRLTERVLVACRQVHHSPLIVGLGGGEQVSADIQRLVERQGMPWMAAISPSARPDKTELWQAVEPVLTRLN